MSFDPAGLLSAHTIRCATLDPEGWPHVVPLWFVVDDDDVWVSTLDGTAKVRHIERDPRATLLLDEGEDLVQLRGFMLHADAAVVRDRDAVQRTNAAMLARYADHVPDGFAEALEQQPRVAVQFRPVRIRSWDNRTQQPAPAAAP